MIVDVLLDAEFNCVIFPSQKAVTERQNPGLHILGTSFNNVLSWPLLDLPISAM